MDADALDDLPLLLDFWVRLGAREIRVSVPVLDGKGNSGAQHIRS